MTPKQTAIQSGDMFYEGIPCSKAGHTTKYASNSKCVECYRNIKLSETQKEKHREAAARYDKKLRETVEGRKYLSEKWFRTKYGITSKDWIRMYEEQNGICANPDCDFTHHPRWWEQGTGIGFCVDHDHKTKEVRGLLCTSCNTLEGLVFKNPKIISHLK